MLQKFGQLIKSTQNLIEGRIQQRKNGKITTVEGVVLDIKQVQNLLKQWITHVHKSDVPSVIALYADKSVLHPTFQDKMITNQKDKVTYFTHFLSKNPKAKILQNKSYNHVNLAINTGIYRFSYTDQGKKHRVTARYTFTYEYLQKQWLITSHVSAEAPKK